MPKKQSNPALAVAVVGALATVVVAIITKLDFGSQKPNPPKENPSSITTPSAGRPGGGREFIPITFEEVAALLRDDSRTAIQKEESLAKFGDKWVLWHGYVRNVTRVGDSIVVVVGPAKGEHYSLIALQLRTTEKRLVDGLKPDDHIEYEGRIQIHPPASLNLFEAVIIRKL